MADALQIIAEMTGRSAGYKVQMQSLREIAGWTKKREEKSGDEIVMDIINRAGLRARE